MMLSLICSEVDAAPETESVAASNKGSTPIKEDAKSATVSNSSADTERRITMENETIWLEEKLSPTTQWLEKAVNPLRRWMEDKVQRPAKQETPSIPKNIDRGSAELESSANSTNSADTSPSQSTPLINSSQAGLIATSQVAGDVLKVKLLRNAPMRYRVKLISLQGQIHYVYINASNAQIIKQPLASPDSPETKVTSP